MDRLTRMPKMSRDGAQGELPRPNVGTVARLLGVSLPRLHRLLNSEGVPPAGGRGHQRNVSPEVARRLVHRIGAVPSLIGGYDRTDMLVLAAMARAPLGLASARAVA